MLIEITDELAQECAEAWTRIKEEQEKYKGFPMSAEYVDACKNLSRVNAEIGALVFRAKQAEVMP